MKLQVKFQLVILLLSHCAWGQLNDTINENNARLIYKTEKDSSIVSYLENPTTKLPFTGVAIDCGHNNKWSGISNCKMFSLSHYLAGQLQGPAYNFYDNGNVRSSVNYRLGKREGEYKEFNQSGILIVEGEYENDMKNGFWFFYNENGEREEFGRYKNDLKDNVWNFVDSAGIYLQEFYKNDTLTGSHRPRNEDDNRKLLLEIGY